MIRPYVCQKIELPGLFLDQYLQMLCGHVVLTYGGSPLPREDYRGGFAPWQKRRALDYLEQNLSGNLRVNRLAAECGVSASHFCRCFRSAFGTSLHKFVVNKRIERARQLLLCSKLSIAEISIEVGFSDQAALSRTFAANVGAPPARWRTEHLVRSRASLKTPPMDSDQLPIVGETEGIVPPLCSIPGPAGNSYMYPRIGRITSPTFQ
jgi:AraC-like DNA-binding protein